MFEDFVDRLGLGDEGDYSHRTRKSDGELLVLCRDPDPVECVESRMLSVEHTLSRLDVHEFTLHEQLEHGAAERLCESSDVMERHIRAGIEGLISFLKRAFGLNRCTWRGAESFTSYVLGSVLAANFLTLARHLLA